MRSFNFCLFENFLPIAKIERAGIIIIIIIITLYSVSTIKIAEK